MKDTNTTGLLPEINHPPGETAEEHRDKLIIAAAKEHRILAAEVDWYKRQYDRDPVGTQHLLASPEPGTAIMAQPIKAKEGTGLLPEIDA